LTHQNTRRLSAQGYFGCVTSNDWPSQFRQVFDHGVAAWNEGRNMAATMFPPADVQFLASIGYTAQEMFDFVDDFQRYGEPDVDTALAVASIRRSYFLEVLQGKPATLKGNMDDLPSKSEMVDGLAWLPRIIVKARWKLRGEMPDDLMYGCGGDRAFLESIRMTMPQFLQLVWDAGNDDRRIIEAVKKSAGRL
jgi:hypothetical protein